MKIYNNFNNNKQVNFKADVRFTNEALDKAIPKMIEMGKKAKGTKGNLVFVSHLLEPSYDNKCPDLFRTRFDYFKKNETFPSATKDVMFITPKPGVYKLVNGANISDKELNFDESLNVTTENFQKFMDSVSKK